MFSFEYHDVIMLIEKVSEGCYDGLNGENPHTSARHTYYMWNTKKPFPKALTERKVYRIQCKQMQYFDAIKCYELHKKYLQTLPYEALEHHTEFQNELSAFWERISDPLYAII